MAITGNTKPSSAFLKINGKKVEAEPKITKPNTVEFIIPISELPVVIKEKRIPTNIGLNTYRSAGAYVDPTYMFTVVVNNNDEISTKLTLKDYDILNGKGAINTTYFDIRGKCRIELTSNKLDAEYISSELPEGRRNSVKKFNIGIIETEKTIMYENSDLTIGNISIINHLKLNNINYDTTLSVSNSRLPNVYVGTISESGELVIENAHIEKLETIKVKGNLTIKNSVIDKFKYEIENGRITYINSKVNGAWYDHYTEQH